MAFRDLACRSPALAALSPTTSCVERTPESGGHGGHVRLTNFRSSTLHAFFAARFLREHLLKLLHPPARLRTSPQTRTPPKRGHVKREHLCSRTPLSLQQRRWGGGINFTCSFGRGPQLSARGCAQIKLWRILEFHVVLWRRLSAKNNNKAIQYIVKVRVP